ncbi:hypothetical protein [Aurantiacibacter luteus]|nr:hypothetical protein [Aurantiacibacter luteus]
MENQVDVGNILSRLVRVVGDANPALLHPFNPSCLSEPTDARICWSLA